MKAIHCTRYGSPEVLQFREMEKPIPKDNEVLIRVFATTVTSGDCRVRALNAPSGFALIMRLGFGISKPRNPILGTELSGEVEAVGKRVTKFKPEDQVFATGGFGMGCYVEYKAIPETGLIARKPANLSYEEATSIPFGGTTALNFFKRGSIQRGEKVLINGASGSVGTAAVQLARNLGAEVTGVCSTVNVDLVKSVGAEKVIDYTQEDFTKNGETYDIIMDTVGTAPFSRCRDSLSKNGRLLLVLSGLSETLLAPVVSLKSSLSSRDGGKKVIAGPAAESAEDLNFLGKLAEAGKFKPVIDRTYPFEHIVEAHRYVDQGHKKGSVAITVAEH